MPIESLSLLGFPKRDAALRHLEYDCVFPTPSAPWRGRESTRATFGMPASGTAP